MGQPPAQPAEAPPSAAQPPARAPPPRGVQELGAALGLDPAVRDELQRTMTLLPANTLVNVNTAPPEVIAALAPGLSIGQARAIAGERDRGNAFNNSGDFANRLAGAGFGHAARRRHRQRLVHGARRGGLRTRPPHRAGAAARHARRRARDRLDERRQLKNTLRIALPLGDAGRGHAAALCLVRPARPLRAAGRAGAARARPGLCAAGLRGGAAPRGRDRVLAADPRPAQGAPGRRRAQRAGTHDPGRHGRPGHRPRPARGRWQRGAGLDAARTAAARLGAAGRTWAARAR